MAAFAGKLARSGIEEFADRTDVRLRRRRRLRGCGLIVVNPPWTLHANCKVLLPALAEILCRGAPNPPRLEWLAGDAVR